MLNPEAKNQNKANSEQLITPQKPPRSQLYSFIVTFFSVLIAIEFSLMAFGALAVGGILGGGIFIVIYAFISFILIFFFRKLGKLLAVRRYGILLLIFIGLGFIAGLELVLPVTPITYTYQSIIAPINQQKVEISNIKDELYLSTKGNPLGIRLSYTLQYPYRGLHFLETNLYPKGYENYYGPFTLRAKTISIQALGEEERQIGGSEGVTLKGGIRYTIKGNYTPAHNSFENQAVPESCRSLRSGESMEKFEKNLQNIMSSYFTIEFRDEITKVTRLSYNPRIFYEGCLKEFTQ